MRRISVLSRELFRAHKKKIEIRSRSTVQYSDISQSRIEHTENNILVATPHHTHAYVPMHNHSGIFTFIVTLVLPAAMAFFWPRSMSYVISITRTECTWRKGQIYPQPHSSVFDQNLLKGSVAPLWAAFPHRYYLFPPATFYLEIYQSLPNNIPRKRGRCAPFAAIHDSQSL